MAFIYEVNGVDVEFDTEPNERDIDEAASKLGIPQLSPSDLHGPESYTGRVVRRQGEAQEQRAGRVDILPLAGESLKETGGDLMARTRLQNLGALMSGKIHRDIGKTALFGVGGVIQRGVATAANPIIKSQEGKFEQILPSIAKGFAGKELGEAGDWLRNIGAPELTAQIGGLGIEALIPGPKQAGNFIKSLRRGVQIVLKKGARKFGRKGIELSMRVLQDEQPEVIGFLLDDHAKAMSKKYLSKGAANNFAKNIDDEIQTVLYKPASKAYDDVLETAGNQSVSNIDEITKGLRKLEQTGVASQQEITKITSALNALTVDDLTVKKALTVQRTLRKAASKSTIDAEAVSIIGVALEKQVPALKAANVRWAMYKETFGLFEEITGGIRTAGTYTGVGRLPKNPQKLLNYFSNESPLIREGLDGIQTVLMEQSGRTIDIITDIKRAATAETLKKLQPGFKGVLIGGAAGFGLQNPYAASIILAASSPRLSGSLIRGGFAAGEGLASAAKTPLAQALGKGIQPVVDQSILRQVTGRNR